MMSKARVWVIVAAVGCDGGERNGGWAESGAPGGDEYATSAAAHSEGEESSASTGAEVDQCDLSDQPPDMTPRNKKLSGDELLPTDPSCWDFMRQHLQTYEDDTMDLRWATCERYQVDRWAANAFIRVCRAAGWQSDECWLGLKHCRRFDYPGSTNCNCQADESPPHDFDCFPIEAWYLSPACD